MEVRLWEGRSIDKYVQRPITNKTEHEALFSQVAVSIRVRPFYWLLLSHAILILIDVDNSPFHLHLEIQPVHHRNVKRVAFLSGRMYWEVCKITYRIQAITQQTCCDKQWREL